MPLLPGDLVLNQAKIVQLVLRNRICGHRDFDLWLPKSNHFLLPCDFFFLIEGFATFLNSFGFWTETVLDT